MDFSANPRANTTRRILALWLPRLSTDRLKRKDVSLSKAAPLVVSGKANNALYVHALEERAQRLGLYKDQLLANARAMMRELTIFPADEKKTWSFWTSLTGATASRLSSPPMLPMV